MNLMRVPRIGHFPEVSAPLIDPPFCHLAPDINAWSRPTRRRGLGGISGLHRVEEVGGGGLSGVMWDIGYWVHFGEM